MKLISIAYLLLVVVVAAMVDAIFIRGRWWRPMEDQLRLYRRIDIGNLRVSGDQCERVCINNGVNMQSIYSSTETVCVT
jgi:hypothetical protein